VNVKNIKFKVPKDYLKKKIDNLVPYKTYQEKNFLINEPDDPKEILKYLLPETQNKNFILNNIEAIVLIYKLREISVSDVIEGTLKCSFCDFVNPFQIEIQEIVNINDENLDNSIPIGVFEDITDIIDEEIVDEMLLKDIIDIQEKIFNNNEKIYKPLIQRRCIKCNNVVSIDINYKDIVSKVDLAGLFKQEFNLGFYMHWGKKDVDDSYPFERELMALMLKKKVETPV
jgi:hypothetical protein